MCAALTTPAISAKGAPHGSFEAQQRGLPCDRPHPGHIGPQLRCYEPRGAMSCGSPMPRGERIAKPAEWGHPRGRLFFGGRRSRIADRQREETMNAYGRLLV